MKRMKSRVLSIVCSCAFGLSLIGITPVTNATPPGCFVTGHGCAAECGDGCDSTAYYSVYCQDCDCTTWYFQGCCSCA
jgi:hypothetical protein